MNVFLLCKLFVNNVQNRLKHNDIIAIYQTSNKKNRYHKIYFDYSIAFIVYIDTIIWAHSTVMIYLYIFIYERVTYYFIV